MRNNRYGISFVWQKISSILFLKLGIILSFLAFIGMQTGFFACIVSNIDQIIDRLESQYTQNSERELDNPWWKVSLQNLFWYNQTFDSVNLCSELAESFGHNESFTL